MTQGDDDQFQAVLTRPQDVGINTNMRAKLLLKERFQLDEDKFAEIVIWQVPSPVPGCSHSFKYRLALVAAELCVLRYDNESGKGDHKHVGDRLAPYEFLSLERLLDEFQQDILNWRPQ